MQRRAFALAVAGLGARVAEAAMPAAAASAASAPPAPPAAVEAAPRRPAAAVAGRERVRVFATTDRPLVQALLEDFERRHPLLWVDYHELGSAELFERVQAAGDAGAEGPDVVWSSAMDLQIKLVNDGHAARHVSVHAARLPRWAVWKHEAYGTGPEPVGMVVRSELAPPAGLPRTHAALAALLAAQGARLRGRIVTYDIARAGLGYLLAAQDLIANPRHWELVQALGRAAAAQHAESRSMLEQVAAGRALLAYNVLGSYAEPFVRRHPGLAMVYFEDYTLVATRVAFVARRAPNAAGGRLWLDHLLSVPGQQALARHGGLHPIRADAAEAGGSGPAGSPPGLLPGPRPTAALRPITLGPGLLAHLDQSKRAAILRRWAAAFAAA
ncbi:MAG: ABC transporter substrate-binding protein [Burkholderiales bacterium]|nr:ABC transporter substrate-binding protein [Burkholderiales bacterium]